MAQEITLPVKLQIENLQNITKEMRSQLGTLKVDSSGYKKLENVIMDIEKRIQQLQVISSRPFVDTKQFTAVSKEIIGIQDDLTKVRIEAGKVKFSDLQLDASQKAKLQELDTQIKSINDQLKQVKDSAKNTFFETDVGKVWKLNHTDDVGKTFTQITKIIEGEVAKQEKALHDAEQAQTDYQERLAARKKLSSFINNGHGLTRENLGEDVYNSIFDKNGNFKSGGKSALQTWLEEQFKLDHNVVQALTDQAGKKVREAFENTKGEVDRALKQERTRINSSLTEENNRTNKGQTYAQDIVAAQASLDAAKATKEGLSQTNIKLAKTEEDLSNALRKAKLDREAYMQAVTRAAAGQLQMGSSCDKARAQLDSLNHIVDTGKAKLASLDQATSKLQGISNFVNRYVGAYAIIRKVSTAIRNAFNNIKELDKVITSIAVVTNMSQEDLWNKVGQYTAMAQEYGVATKDVYTVSQIFYQQGLQTAQVMDLTVETLKMAKIAGMEYSAAANAMTVAVRAFKIEMSDAQQVTDTYSALAAKFAVSSAEIANAMEKTASSAASVGMSLQSTSAFMSVMIQTTRESAQNIGSALKSIISRYGEMKASPSSLINVDGEEVAFNKVDTALASIGISIKDAAGQFRDFDDVIMELAAKWNTLDNNTQRYIATVMAGNRQQSRFIALVSNYDELSRAMSVASNAENASIVQVAKTMDSLESKANQLKNAFSQLYLDLHIENGLKDIYDWITRILKTVGKLGTLNGVLPTLANIIGLGTGTKSLLKSGMDFVQSQKGKYQLETQEAEDKVKAIRAEAERDIIAKYKIQADASELDAQKLLLQNQLDQASLRQQTASSIAYNTYRGALPAHAQALSQAEFEKKLVDPNALKKELQGSNINSEAQKNIEAQASKYQEASNAVQTLTTSINDLVSAIQTLTGAKEEETSATETNTGATETNTGTTEQEVETKTQEVSSTQQVTDAQIDLAQKTGTSASELELLSDKKESAIAAQELEKQASEDNTRQKQQEAQGSKEAEIADRQEAGASREAANESGGGGWSSHPLAMKITGIATGAVRMLSTAITAAGAAHQDQVGESFLGYSGANGNGVELSKMYTGLGNGLSMAGTGASMLMTLGPWGAAIGAIGGFLIGGLGALIDGATMTLEEQLAIEKEAAKKASDDALKASAKSADLSNQIDNIKQLQKAMYNSTEDMQAYKDAMNTMASEYPALVSAYDEAGNAIIDLNQAEVTLMQTRLNASIAANQAAKAEAQTRKTTIDILHEAQNTIVAGTNRVGTTLKDRSGKAHSFYDNNTWWQIVESAQNAGNNVTNWTLNDYIDYLNTYSGNNGMVKAWKQKFENVSIADNGEISLGDLEYRDKSGIKEYKQANEVLKNHATDLNITKASDVDEDMAYIYGFMGWDKTIELTAERIEEFEKRLSERIQGYEKLVAILDEQLPITDAQESLDYALLDKDTEKAAKISTSKIAAKLIANQLTIAAKEKKLTAGQWSRIEDEQLASEYEDAKTSATDIVVEWLTGLSNDALDKTITAFGSMTEYRSVDEVLQKLGYVNKSDFIQRSGLENDQAQSLLQSWELSFIDSNKANRDRILKTIFNNNDKNHINSELSGLKHFSTETYDEYYDDYIENNPAIEIAKYFTKSSINPIISKYADYFTTQLLDINKLAEDGYTNLASTRLSVLSDLATTLSQIDDSKIQNELFATITSIDLSNYDTIVKAIDSIKSYEQINGQTAETSLLIEQLTAAKNSLIFNVNTLVQDLTESISSAAKNIDSTLSTNKSGMDLSKALDQLASINATRDANDILSFNEIFDYDATLGKYVYNQKGLIESINLVEGQLEDKASQLEKSVDNYLSNDVLMELRAEDSSGKARNLTKDALVSFIDKRASLSEQSKILYANLAQQFIDLQQGQAFTWEQFIDFLIKQGKDVADLKALTDEQLAAYQENKKNQLYQNIDWASIALDTDYFDTNKTLMDELAKELQVQGEYTWKTITEKYLDTIKNPQARIAAQNALNDSIIQSKVSQYQTAISELLNYSANKYLSEQTKVLLNKKGIPLEDLEKNAQNTIKAAKIFLSTLAKQIGQAGYTLEQYNQDAGSILEQTLSRQSIGKTLLDFASSDSINAGSLESLANSLNLQLTDLVDVETGIVKDALAGHLVFNKNTGAYDITTSFEDFIDALNAKYGNVIDKTSQQYVEALKSWNDTQIEKEHKVDKAVTEELQSILKMQPGEQLNLAQTYTAIQSHLGSLYSQFEDETLGRLGADFENGILTIRKGANVQGIIQAIAQEAADAGALLPEEFEQIKQALVDALRDIANIISNGIDGSISADNRRTLENWAKDHNIGDLQFIETAEGFQLATESAKELYAVVENIDHLQGQVIFEKLKDNLIETNENFKTASANAAYIKNIASEGLTSNQQTILQNLNGNVDLFNRPVIQNDDGTISTIYTMTEESRHFESEVPWVMNITPITPEGEWLTDDNFHTYIQELIDETGGNMDEMIKLDKSKLGLIIEGENTEIDQQEKILDAYDERAEKLHEISAAIEENKNKSAEELALAQQINEARGLTEDDSFSFMDNEIPSGQNNPLNYWQSWSDAYTAIQDSISGTNKGTMDYTDFYNIITEMGNLTEITGQAITLGEQTFSNASEAADLITKAAGALQVQADGSLKIDLSQIGVDFASGADALNENVANGIQQLSASQIEMLDSLISLLEVIVTMEEAFKNLDVDSDLNLSLDEMFNLDGAENITGFSETWEKSLETMREMLSPNLEKYNEDFARGMESIKFTINDKLLSLADIIQMDFSEVESTMGTDFYNTLMNSIYQAALSGDYSETNVKEIIMQKLREGLEGTDTEITFDMGNYTFIGTSNGTVEINWDKQSVQDAVERHGREAILEAKKAVANGSATTTQIEYSLEADGIVYVKNGTNTIKGPDGKEYSYGKTGYSEALAAGMLQDLGNVKNIQMGAKNTATATGTITWGKFELQVEANANEGNTIFTSKTDDGYTITATSQEDFINQLVEKRYSSWESLNSDASDQVKAEKKIKLQYEAEVEAGISSFELNSQSYQKISDESRTRLESALASGSTAEIQLAIQADPELSSLEGLSSSEIEEKLGLKEIKMKVVGDTEEATAQITTLGETVTTLVGNENKITVTADVSKAATSLNTVESKEKAVEDHSPINIDVKAPNASKVATSLQTIINKQETINDTKVIVDVSTSGDVAATQSALESINSQLMSIAQNKVQNIQITETTTKVTSGGGNTNSTVVMEQATGNVGLAKAQGTLMGELGPELVVSNGKYFVAGQNGPEMVNLADDAIVFNHLQTEQLLKHGTSTGRGQAITNERNAVAFAGGNISGPAMASASSVLATLKQLRALWQSLQGTTAQDLAGLGGSGSGGGGGSDDSATARNSYLADVERWYNWLQKIAVLEEKINTEEAKRSKYQADMVARGAEYAKSNLQTLKDLQSEAVTYQALANTQQEFFDLRRSQLNDSAFSRFYTFDENGQLKYNDNDLGYKFLAELMARDDYGEAKYSAEQQYNMLVGAGMEAYMKYDSSGTEILMDEDSEDQSSFYSSSVQAFWDLVDSQKEEMQTLHDSINEYGDSVIEKQTAAYEIMKEIEDNQISVEDKVYNALVDLRQRAIDELQNQRDAIEKASNNLINGLTEQLNKEKDMYSQTESTNELYSLQRQLAVLQRSGGAASAIASLQKEIASKQQDMYYDAQQRQIDALQEASDNELAKLDEEISLMTETLEYEKEHGFLWQEIADIMRGSPEDIATYIFQNDSQFWGDSPTKQTQTYREALFEAQQFVQYRDSITDGIDGLAQQFSDYVISQKAQEEAANKSTDTGSAGSGSGGGGSGGGSDDDEDDSSSSSSSSTTTTASNQQKTKTVWEYNHVEYDTEQKAKNAQGQDYNMQMSLANTPGIPAAAAASLKAAASKTAQNKPKQKTVNLTQYSSGGMVDEDQYALVHAKESVLTPRQTSILRNEILGNKPTSLLNLLTNFKDAYDDISGASSYSSVNNTNGVTIEQAVVEMHVSKIANDYDAQRAGEQALEKMLTIARKTSAQNRIGR